jgi:hypothetical protein
LASRSQLAAAYQAADQTAEASGAPEPSSP